MKIFLVTVLILLTAKSAVLVNQSRRIIGGGPGNIADFPYTLALRRNSEFVCAASAVHRLWAITAASCFNNGVNTPTQFQLRGGSSNREVGGFLFNVNLITIHPSYVAATQEFNVGLARVFESTPIEGFQVQIIPIAPLCSTGCCNTCVPQLTVATGWGVDESNVQPLTMRQIVLPVVDLASCSSSWSQPFGNNWFCLESTSQRGFCDGDLGNPTVTTIAGVRFQTGIVVRWNCRVDQPAVVVRLEETRIRNWIQWVIGA